jgi:hypothetical protein
MSATINWHADGDGKCHSGCEQYHPQNSERPGIECEILAVLPWIPKMVVPGMVGWPCPFAVLADVFRLHERPGKETP